MKLLIFISIMHFAGTKLPTGNLQAMTDQF